MKFHENILMVEELHPKQKSDKENQETKNLSLISNRNCLMKMNIITFKKIFQQV